MPRPVELKGGDLALADVERVARPPFAPVVLAAAARERIVAARALVERAVAEGRVVYGITT